MKLKERAWRVWEGAADGVVAGLTVADQVAQEVERHEPRLRRALACSWKVVSDKEVLAAAAALAVVAVTMLV